MGMGGGGGGQVSAPDPTVASSQEFGFNLNAAEANQRASMVNQVTPFGKLTYSQTGTDTFRDQGGNQWEVPTYTSYLNLDPVQQQLLDTYNTSKQTAGTQAENLLTNANYGGKNPSDVIGTQTQGIEGDLMKGWRTAQEPWMELTKQQQDTQLRNQGLSPSPTATTDPATWGPYERAMNQLNQSQQMAEAQASSEFQPQAFGEATQLYQLPLNIALQEGAYGSPYNLNSSLINPPQFNVNPPNYSQNLQTSVQAQEFNAAQRQAEGASMTQGLFGLGSSVLGMFGGGI